MQVIKMGSLSVKLLIVSARTVTYLLRTVGHSSLRYHWKTKFIFPVVYWHHVTVRYNLAEQLWSSRHMVWLVPALVRFNRLQEISRYGSEIVMNMIIGKWRMLLHWMWKAQNKTWLIIWLWNTIKLKLFQMAWIFHILKCLPSTLDSCLSYVVGPDIMWTKRLRQLLRICFAIELLSLWRRKGTKRRVMISGNKRNVL